MMRVRLLAIVLCAALAWGVIYLLGLQFESGDVYPEYSSLRADPLGAKMLFDTLARIPGVSVSRTFTSLELVKPETTVFLLGWHADGLADAAETLRKTAQRGIRVVAALVPAANTRTDSLKDAWGLSLVIDRRARHKHEMYFPDTGGWTIVDHAGPKILALEKNFGTGSIAIWTESDDFANESTAAGDRFETITAAIGPNQRVVFDELHFGIQESGTVVALARRFHLTGLAIGLGLCTALLIWRNISGFPPAAENAPGDRFAGRTSHAGLLTLLRRNIPREQIAAACFEEWLAGNRAGLRTAKVQRAAALVREPSADPVETARELQAVLQTKGDL